MIITEEERAKLLELRAENTEGRETVKIRPFDALWLLDLVERMLPVCDAAQKMVKRMSDNADTDGPLSGYLVPVAEYEALYSES